MQCWGRRGVFYAGERIGVGRTSCMPTADARTIPTIQYEYDIVHRFLINWFFLDVSRRFLTLLDPTPSLRDFQFSGTSIKRYIQSKCNGPRSHKQEVRSSHLHEPYLDLIPLWWVVGVPILTRSSFMLQLTRPTPNEVLCLPIVSHISTSGNYGEHYRHDTLQTKTPDIFPVYSTSRQYVGEYAGNMSLLVPYLSDSHILQTN